MRNKSILGNIGVSTNPKRFDECDDRLAPPPAVENQRAPPVHGVVVSSLVVLCPLVLPSTRSTGVAPRDFHEFQGKEVEAKLQAMNIVSMLGIKAKMFQPGTRVQFFVITLATMIFALLGSLSLQPRRFLTKLEITKVTFQLPHSTSTTNAWSLVGIDPSTSSIADFACEVEIIECEPLPDGRFYLEVEGRRRFRILRSWDQDGYRVAEVEWIQDTLPPEHSQEREDIRQMAGGAAELTKSWIKRAREVTRIEDQGNWNFLKLKEYLSRRILNVSVSGYLCVVLINPLNLRPSERLELLRLRDARERISSSGLKNKVAESNNMDRFSD
ncbi:hypothetical protein OPV22_020970 [Ensete ventricosum]|uniref:Lon N-terminal domain-containing protein n=1 Tax=Ensete ventricosum TaxID=4639 RepID=A0AAV8QK49_ENSVE|nr:hypothetical protein OPV22_020970 [Ensete ventricosum]